MTLSIAAQSTSPSVLDQLAQIPQNSSPHAAHLNGPGANYLDRIVDQTRLAIGTLDSKIQGALGELAKDPGNVGLMVQLQLEVGKRSLQISTTTGLLKGAKDDTLNVARAL